MIDINKPLRTTDGRRATFVKLVGPGEAEVRIEGKLRPSHVDHMGDLSWTFCLRTGQWFAAGADENYTRIENYEPLDLTKPVFTRDGRAVELITTELTPALRVLLKDADEASYINTGDVIVGRCLAEHGDEYELNGYNAEGRFLEDIEAPEDLTNTPPAPTSTTFYATARYSGSRFIPGIHFGTMKFDNSDEALRVARQTPSQWDSVVKVAVSEGKLVDVEHIDNV